MLLFALLFISDGLPSFPMDIMYLQAVRKRISVAKRIETVLHRQRKVYRISIQVLFSCVVYIYCIYAMVTVLTLFFLSNDGMPIGYGPQSKHWNWNWMKTGMEPRQTQLSPTQERWRVSKS